MSQMPPKTRPRQWLPEERSVPLSEGNADNPLLLTVIEFPDGTQAVTTEPLSENQQKASHSGQLNRESLDLRMLESPES